MLRTALLLITLLGAPDLALARAPDMPTAWEYAVVFLPGTVNQGRRPTIEQLPSGAFLDRVKTDALNQLAAEGWEVIAITGDSGADHAVYLRRPISSS